MSGNSIGTLNEKHLHAQLKAWMLEQGDLEEVPLDGYIVDILRDDLLIEIQTKNFSTIKRKLFDLTSKNHVRLAYPIAQERWILKIHPHGSSQPSRRKSPKRGDVLDVFSELVSFPALIREENFSIELIIIEEEQVRQFGRTRRGRMRWITEERRLLGVLNRVLLESPEDVWALIPSDLPPSFTTSDLAEALKRPRWFAQKVAYCLKHMDAITPCGKNGRSILYVCNLDQGG